MKDTHLILQKLGNLQKIEQNLRKSVNQVISAHTLLGHLENATELYGEIDELLIKNQDQIPDVEFFAFIKQSRNALSYIKESLRIRKINTNKTMTTTSEAPFDAKLAASILTPFDGDASKLSAFVDGVKFLKNVATTETQKKMLKLFLLTRISGKARDALPSDIANLTIDEVLRLIITNCESKITTDQILAKLKSIKKGLPKQQYCQEVEDLCDKLTNTYVRENIAHATAKKLATKAGLDALINVVSSNNSKIVLQAGTFTSIEQATQKLNELPDVNENSDNTNRIFNVNSNQRRNQFQGMNQRGNWRRGTNHNGNNFSPRGFHSDSQRFTRYRQNTHNGNYRGARGNSRGHGHSYQGRPFSRIYFADNQTSFPTQNVPFNSAQCVQNQEQPNWSMMQQQQQTFPPQNQNFLGTVRQYTQ